jgi:hypothetical protein
MKKICYWRLKEKDNLRSKRIPEVICYNYLCPGKDEKCREFRPVAERTDPGMKCKSK